MVEFKYRGVEYERRREAVQVGRNGIGRQLRRSLEEVLSEPVPGYWLALLSAADHREGDDPTPPRAG